MRIMGRVVLLFLNFFSAVGQADAGPGAGAVARTPRLFARDVAAAAGLDRDRRFRRRTHVGRHPAGAALSRRS